MIIAKREKLPTWATASLVTLLVVVAIEGFVRAGILKIPNPATLTLIAVVYAGCSSGLTAGLFSSALAVLYAIYHFSAPGAPLQFAQEDATRIAVLAFVAPFMAWLTGTLRDRAERTLQMQLSAERVHVAELERAERRIRNRETQLRALIDALPAYVAYVDRDLRIRFHNRAYEDWTGLPASFIDGRTVAEVVGAELFESGTRQHALAALEGKPALFERVQTDKQGNRRAVEAHFIPDVAEDGTVAGYFGMLFDVSHFKDSQARIARLTERLRRALAASRLVLWELDMHTGMVELGREWAEIVGGERIMSQVKLSDLRRRVHPEDRASLDEAFQSVIERRADKYDIEHRVQALDGDWKWIRSTGGVVEFDPTGRPLRMSGTNRDITPRKRAELLVQESESSLRLITDAVPAMIVYVDSELRYRFCNRGYRETMGRGESEILGRTVLDVVGEKQYEVSRHWLEKALAGEQSEHERRMPRPGGGGMMDLSVTYVPHAASNGKILGLYALLVDLTERKRAERIKERFISMVSHELRTPLTSIIWTLESLGELASDNLSGEAKSMVAVAQQNAERMLHLADEILDLEEIDQSEMRMSPRRFGLPELAGRVIALNQGLAQKHDVQVVCAGAEAADVSADPDRIVQVLSNLVSNAAKHSPRGSRVEIDIEPRGDKIRVSVRDRGPGVPEEFRQQLFGRFAQSTQGRKMGGSGLGLAISKEIVERSGGAIGYAQNPGGGSEFWFELPSAPPLAAVQ